MSKYSLWGQLPLWKSNLLWSKRMGGGVAQPVLVTAESAVCVSLFTAQPVIAGGVENERYGPTLKKYFWGQANRPIVYTTGMFVPDEADGAMLKLQVDMRAGKVAKIEYGYGESRLFWGDHLFWADDSGWSFWGVPPSPEEWLIWGNGLVVHAGEYIFIRITTGTGEAAQMCDVKWIFDVEDAEYSMGDVAIAAEGTRLPVPEKYFRWIKVVNLTLQKYGEDDRSFTVKAIDKGIDENGGTTGEIVQGPMVVCRDENGNYVPGNVDAILQGARGSKYVADSAAA